MFNFRRLMPVRECRIFLWTSTGAGGSALRPWPFETVLVSMLLEHKKAQVELEMKIRGGRRRKKNRKS
jgi:hypothetical protein